MLLACLASGGFRSRRRLLSEKAGPTRWRFVYHCMCLDSVCSSAVAGSMNCCRLLTQVGGCPHVGGLPSQCRLLQPTSAFLAVAGFSHKQQVPHVPRQRQLPQPSPAQRWLLLLAPKVRRPFLANTCFFSRCQRPGYPSLGPGLALQP